MKRRSLILSRVQLASKRCSVSQMVLALVCAGLFTFSAQFFGVHTPHASRIDTERADCPHADAIDEILDLFYAAKAANITMFPRNGFLLGVVRHGGLNFLPQETDHIDADVGVFDSPQLRRTTTLVGAHGQFYSIRIRDRWPVWWIRWVPWLRAPPNIPFQVDVESDTGHTTEMNFFRRLPSNPDKVGYPIIASLNNIKSRLEENREYTRTGKKKQNNKNKYVHNGSGIYHDFF